VVVGQCESGDAASRVRGHDSRRDLALPRLGRLPHGSQLCGRERCRGCAAPLYRPLQLQAVGLSLRARGWRGGERRRSGWPERRGVPHSQRLGPHRGRPDRGHEAGRCVAGLGGGAPDQGAPRLRDRRLYLRAHRGGPELPRGEGVHRCHRRRWRGGRRGADPGGLARAPDSEGADRSYTVFLRIQRQPEADPEARGEHRGVLREGARHPRRVSRRGRPVGGELRRHADLSALLRARDSPLAAPRLPGARRPGQDRGHAHRRREPGAHGPDPRLRLPRGRVGDATAHDQGRDRGVLPPVAAEAHHHGRHSRERAAAGNGDRGGLRGLSRPPVCERGAGRPSDPRHCRFDATGCRLLAAGPHRGARGGGGTPAACGGCRGPGSRVARPRCRTH